MLQSDTVAGPAAPILELNEPTAAIFRQDAASKTSFSAIGLVLLCTVIGAAAQVLYDLLPVVLARPQYERTSYENPDPCDNASHSTTSC